MHRTRQRLIAVALALAFAVLAPLLAVAPASAAGPYDGRTVISQGHADIFYSVLDEGAPQLLVHDDTGATEELRDPADVVFHVRPSVDGIVAPVEIPGLAPAGTQVYVLPQTNEPGRIFGGYGHELPAGSSVTYTIDGFEGPGEFATWSTGPFGGFNTLLTSTVAGSSFTDTADHAHTAWGFSALGEYTVTMSTVVQLPGGGAPIAAAPAVYTFYVGEELPVDDPDPDPDPVVGLSISGLAAHYHAGEVASLSAVQDPVSDEDHYHWFTRAAGETAWTVVPGALGADYGFIVRTADHGTEVIARLYDHDHAVIAESAPVTVLVDDHGNSPYEGAVITTTLAEEAGTLVISVDEGARDVQLSDLELSPGADRYVATGEVGGVRVTDTRSDDPGWTARGRVRAFTSVDGDTIPGAHLGWSPKVLSSSSGQTVTPGASVAGSLSGGPGVGAWSPMGSAAAGHGRGVAVLGADLVLETPVTQAAGTYQGLMILTII